MLHERCSGNGTAATASAAEVTVGDRGGGGHVRVQRWRSRSVVRRRRRHRNAKFQFRSRVVGVRLVFGLPLSLNRRRKLRRTTRRGGGGGKTERTRTFRPTDDALLLYGPERESSVARRDDIAGNPKSSDRHRPAPTALARRQRHRARSGARFRWTDGGKLLYSYIRPAVSLAIISNYTYVVV